MFLAFLEQYPFALAFLLGLIPALIWLWFWLKEDTHPEPVKMITLSFLGGMVAVIFVLPLQKLVYTYFISYETLSFVLWASIEEVAKFAFIYFIALKHKVTDEPIDDIIYLIVSALGFVTLENSFFLADLVQKGAFLETIINSNLRFVGASLLHVMSSATIGIFMGLSFYKTESKKIMYLVLGLITAIILHTAFNLLIINGAPGGIFLVFGMVWIGIIVLFLLFEKVKRVSKSIA